MTATDIVLISPNKYNNISNGFSTIIKNETKFTCEVHPLDFGQETNELDENRYYIFIGDEKENIFTKENLDTMNDVVDNDDFLYGYQDNKAVIFGKADPKLKYNPNDFKGVGKVGVIAAIAGAAFAPLLAIGGVGAAGYAAYKYFLKNSEKKSRRVAEIQLGFSLFMDESFENWIK